MKSWALLSFWTKSKKNKKAEQQFKVEFQLS